jgi:Uri superfamily endonuclease
MTANAYRCDHCGHHENLHRRNGNCLVLINGKTERWECECAEFVPGDCDRCRGFGCEDCDSSAKSGKW